MMTLYSIGHSTRTLDELIDVLQCHSIEVLADIRSFPTSRRLPYFNRSSLERVLPEKDIRYVWIKELGGLRKNVREDSPHLALRSEGFRNYADHMLTTEFLQGIQKLLGLAGLARTAYMCAERAYTQCHRMFVSDWLMVHGHMVMHIGGTGPLVEHTLTPEARLIDDQLIYRGNRLF